MTATHRPRLAVVVSHPIQHFCPQYASWAANPEVDLCVFFASSAGLRAYEDKNFGRTVKWEGLDVNAFAHSFLDGDPPRPLGLKLDAPELDARLDDFSPDAVLIYGYAMPLQRRALRWARRNHRKTIFLSDSELRHHRPLHRRLAKTAFLRRYLRHFDVFTTVGDANEEYYRTYGVPMERFVRMPFPIDVRSYEASRGDRQRLRVEARVRYGIADDDIVVSMAGKFVSWKRQRDLVAMLDHLGDSPQRIVVLLIGSGAEEATLRAMAERQTRHRVIITGFVQPTELPGLYAASDVYAHVAEKEPHSLAISEAVYMGLPVVLSDRCGSYGPTDDVQVGRNGFVYPCGDTRALASLVARLAAAPDLRASMGHASTAHGTHAQRLSHGEGIAAAMHLAMS